VNPAFHDARFASAGSHGLAHGVLPPGASIRTVPLTPPSPPISNVALSRDAFHEAAKISSIVSP